MEFRDSKLFAPLKIGSMELKNRVGLAPMTLSCEDPNGFVSPVQRGFYRTRAAGGAGFIEVDAVTIDDAVPYRGPTTSLAHDRYIAPMREVTDEVHACGCRILAQIVHAGPESFMGFMGKNPPGPSVYMNDMGNMTRAIDASELPEIVRKFGDAGRRAEAAGFDGIQLHCGHAYMLPGAFLSPLRNHRGDEYGGCLDNRARLILEILAEVRRRVSPDFPIILRVSGDERYPGGNTLNDMLYLAPKFAAAGVSAIEVSGGANYEEPWNIIPCHGCPAGVNVSEAAAIKKIVDIPVFVVGKINDIRYGADLVDRGLVDGIVMGRPFFAEPELVNKALAGSFEDIAPCASCDGCVSYDPNEAFTGPKCHINPRLFREDELPMTPTSGPKKKVLVIGGGIGGMEAAYTAAVRGHTVTLWERSGALGGHLLLACVPPGKQDLSKWLVYLNTQLKKHGVRVELEKEATVESVGAFAPDAVIVATGGEALIPPIPGVGEFPVRTAYEFLEGKFPIPGGRVCVLGSGLVACETAETILQRAVSDVEVTLVDMLPTVLANYTRYNRELLLRRLKAGGVRMLTGARVVEYREREIVVERGDGVRETLGGFDCILFALGAKSRDTLSRALENVVPQVCVIGEAKSAPRMAVKAVQEGFEAAYNL